MRFENYLNEVFNLPSGLKNVWERIKKELRNMTFSEIEKKGAEAFYKLTNDKDLVKDEKAWEVLWQSYVEFPTDNIKELQYLFKKQDLDKNYIASIRADRNVSGMKSYFGMRESTINEDARHWWELIKQEAFPTLAFYPALQIWLEMDKYIKGDSFDTKVMMFYAALWLTLVSGKYITGWMKWKKEKPDEYSKERSMGKGGLV